MGVSIDDGVCKKVISCVMSEIKKKREISNQIMLYNNIVIQFVNNKIMIEELDS